LNIMSNQNQNPTPPAIDPSTPYSDHYSWMGGFKDARYATDPSFRKAPFEKTVATVAAGVPLAVGLRVDGRIIYELPKNEQQGW
jgi:hypothetical protein